ncbi:PepSY domain-containing protein [Paracoccus alkanivorans]|nr:PepSY domain-containing protein [Paracoccus alkanivorans]
MHRFALILVPLLLLPPLAYGQDAVPRSHAMIEAFRPQPLHRIAEAVTDRYEGRIIAAEVRPPLPRERLAGVQLIYEIRLITPQRNLLNIRLDARTGRFLEIAGRGQIEARKRVGNQQ